MVSNAQSSGQDTEDQERLSRCLVLDIILDWIWQEQSRLEINLRQDERQEDSSIDRFSEGKQVGCHTQLGECHRSSTDPLRLVNTKSNWKGLQSQFPVSLDRLEVVDNGNSQTSNRVEDGAEDN